MAVDVFVEKYGAKYPRASECLTKDRDTLLAFYDFPAEHWDHLRTSNPIESVFATVRHRTVRTKGSLSPTTARLRLCGRFWWIAFRARSGRKLAFKGPFVPVRQLISVHGVSGQDGLGRSRTGARRRGNLPGP